MKAKTPTRQNKLYAVWCAMKHRCANPKIKNYGGRGIKVCEEWQTFKPFEDWSLSHGYREGLSIDRIDNDGDYSPKNCRWTDRVTQENNRTNNNKVEFKGEVHTISEWARIIGCSVPSLGHRIRHGWTAEAALTTPFTQSNRKQGLSRGKHEKAHSIDS